MRQLVLAFYWILGLGSLANAAWMLLSPASWFVKIPAGVTDTGPLNPHFVHDVGVAYAVVGIGALYCALRLREARVVHWGVTLFVAGHALVHVAETLTGLLPHAHWWLDFPLTYFPALALLAIGSPPVWRRLQA